MVLTGRELIVYILENNLEDEQVFDNGRFLGFMSINEAAYIFSVGPSTVKMWVELGSLPSIKLGNEYFIPINAKKPVPT